MTVYHSIYCPVAYCAKLDSVRKKRATVFCLYVCQMLAVFVRLME